MPKPICLDGIVYTNPGKKERQRDREEEKRMKKILEIMTTVPPPLITPLSPMKPPDITTTVSHPPLITPLSPMKPTENERPESPLSPVKKNICNYSANLIYLKNQRRHVQNVFWKIISNFVLIKLFKLDDEICELSYLVRLNSESSFNKFFNNYSFNNCSFIH